VSEKAFRDLGSGFVVVQYIDSCSIFCQRFKI